MKIDLKKLPDPHFGDSPDGHRSLHNERCDNQEHPTTTETCRARPDSFYAQCVRWVIGAMTWNGSTWVKEEDDMAHRVAVHSSMRAFCYKWSTYWEHYTVRRQRQRLGIETGGVRSALWLDWLWIR